MFIFVLVFFVCSTCEARGKGGQWIVCSILMLLLGRWAECCEFGWPLILVNSYSKDVSNSVACKLKLYPISFDRAVSVFTSFELIV